MASRYLVATGNWNSTSVWSSTNGGVPGASVPGAGDTAFVGYGHTVTLTADVSIDTILTGSYNSGGRLNMGAYTLDVAGAYQNSLNGTFTLDMGSGILKLNTGNATGYPYFSHYSGETIIPGTSRLEINVSEASTSSAGIRFYGHTYNDVVINVGTLSNATTSEITGSPTFRSLIIQSKNSAAHTVNFDDSDIAVSKLVVVGSSISNRLLLRSPSGVGRFVFSEGGSCYGRAVDTGNFGPIGNGVGTNNFPVAYIGSDSIGGAGTYNWRYEDPPKISTLVDPLTTAPGSNPNWTVSGTVTQVTSGYAGGGYEATSHDAEIVSTGTYDLTGSSLVFERPAPDPGNGFSRFGVGSLSTGSYNGDPSLFAYTMTVPPSSTLMGDSAWVIAESNTAFGPFMFEYPLSSSKFVRIEVLEDGSYTMASSDNATSWTTARSGSLSDRDILMLKSTRVRSLDRSVIGSINLNYNAPPATTLNTPANNTTLTTTTPTLAFTATDPEGEDVSYQIQVSTSSSFTTTHMDVTTTTYASGTQQTRVVSPALTQGGIDYFWRVRAKDPSGSDSYGPWSTARKMTTEALPPSVTSGATTAITTTQATVAGNVSSVNGANLTERGFVYSTSTNPTTANSKITVSGQTGSYSGSLTSLTPNTTYYWRAFATNSKGTTYGVNRSFTTEPRPPVVQTGTPSGTTINSIQVAGSSLTSNPDNQTIDEYGVVYSTSQNPTVSNSKSIASGGSGSYSNNLTGLSENTTYYIRAYAKWRGSDHVYGSQVSFKTQGRPVTTLNTPAASGSVTELRPHLEFTGVDPDSNTITYQLQINTTNTFTSPALDLLSASDPGFTNRSDVKTDPFYSGNQIRYTPQTDLNRGQDYYWRVRGRDTNGSDTWGNWTTARKFTVEPIPASVTITGLGTIESASIAINANITDDGGATVTERGIVWSLTPNPTTSDNKATATGNPFTATATGLTATTEYNFRAYAINAKGTSYSANITQMTLQTEGPPTLTTGEATGIYYTNANVSGEVTLDGRHPVTERGVVFSETANPTTADRKFTAPTAGLGEFSGAITGLDPDTVYYMRAYAINAMGTGYGTQKTFTTLALPEDEDDGYWVFSNSDSTAVVARTQSTPANSSANLFVEPFMERGETYTIHVGDIEADYGEPSLVLEYIEGTLQTIPIAPNTDHTFTYTETMSLVRLRMYVTDGTAVAEELSATFHDLYLAKESDFSGFVNFERRGAKEIKIINNQILDKRREDTLPTIYPKLLGLRYTPFDIKTEGLGYFEVYDGFKIEDPNGDIKTVLLTDKTLTLDGGIQETLQGKAPDKTDTDYSKAGGITKLISQTTLEVDKQRGEIEALVSDVYDNDGYIEEKFTEVFQDINQVRTTVQGAGGVNLIRNSAMYAYNNLGYPESWTTTHVDGEGTTIVIQGSPESQAAGGISAHSFTLNGTRVNQTVTVRKDADFIPDEQKTYYTFNVKVKKNLVGTAYIKLSNREEEHVIDLPNGEEYLWEDFTIRGLLPQDDHYEIEIYSDQDAAAQFTDTMLSVGEYSHAWTQAPGEAMSMVKSDLVDGTYWRSPQSRYEYSRVNHQGLNVHKRIRGQQEEVFRINSDESNMSKIRADKQIAMGGVRIVPMEIDGMTGWALVGED